MKKVIKLTESDLYRIIKRVISEQGPEKKPRQTTMDSKWYADKIKNLVSGLMNATNVNSIYELENRISSDPKQKEFLMSKFIRPLGSLIDSSNPDKMGLSFVNELIYDDRIKLYKINSLPSGPNAWIYELRDSAVKNALYKKIQSTKNTPVN